MNIFRQKSTIDHVVVFFSEQPLPELTSN